MKVRPKDSGLASASNGVRPGSLAIAEETRSSIRTIRRPSSLILMASTLISGKPQADYPVTVNLEYARPLSDHNQVTFRIDVFNALNNQSICTRAPACVPPNGDYTVLTARRIRTAMPCARRSRSVSASSWTIDR